MIISLKLIRLFGTCKIEKIQCILQKCKTSVMHVHVVWYGKLDPRARVYES